MAAPAASAARGRKAVPRNLKLLQGIAPGKDSGGRTVPPPVPFEPGPLIKPAHLSKDASWMWDQIIEHMAGIGLLKPLDALSLETICEVFARWRQAVAGRQRHGLLTQNAQGVDVIAPWVRIEAEAARDFRAWCAEYGLTPASEKNLRSGDDAGGIKDNPFR